MYIVHKFDYKQGRYIDIEYCCKTMAYQIDKGDLSFGGSFYYIYGFPDWAHDGDGIIDEMTEKLSIVYCPFCGKKL